MVAFALGYAKVSDNSPKFKSSLTNIDITRTGSLAISSTPDFDRRTFVKKQLRPLKASNPIMPEHHQPDQLDPLQEFCERLDKRMETIDNLLYLASVSTDDLFMAKQFARRAMEEMRVARAIVRQHCESNHQDLYRVARRTV